MKGRCADCIHLLRCMTEVYYNTPIETMNDGDVDCNIFVKDPELENKVKVAFD